MASSSFASASASDDASIGTSLPSAFPDEDNVTLLLLSDNRPTINGSTMTSSTSHGPMTSALISAICGLIIVGTILGNVLVCTAIGIVRRLRTPSNLLIVSLAVADLLVAALVMPFAAAYEVMGRWVFGQPVCDTWTSLDVLLCTASILNLCMISVDRYFVITKPFQYAMKRTPSRMVLMIAAVWSLSAVISIPPLFGWKADYKEGLCQVSQAISYQFYATIGAFYLPLTVMIVIYTRIYLVSSRIAHAEARSKPTVSPAAAAAAAAAAEGRGSELWSRDSSAGSVATAAATAPLRRDSDGAGAPSPRGVYAAGEGEENHHLQQNGNITTTKRSGEYGGGGGGGGWRVPPTPPPLAPHSMASSRQGLFQKSRLNRISSSNERKATKTLGVIMGAFTACWLPFFILALIKPFCGDPETCIPHWLNGLFLWLGYANSFLNPIIYARFNRDFRTPFRYILQCHCGDINSRLRSENFVEQYGRSEAREISHNLLTEAAQVRITCQQGQSVVKTTM